MAEKTGDYRAISLSIDGRGVARLDLNRPERHNALDRQMIDELHHAAEVLGADEAVRVVVLGAAPCRSFCAGGDLGWFREMAAAGHEERAAGGRALAGMLQALNSLPRPLIGRISGSAYGGGVGMISVCDIAIGVSDARFGLTEVRLGLIPATISPHVVARIGQPAARAVMLSGALFDSRRAERIGLLTEVVAPEDLDRRLEEIVSEHLQAAPQAVARTKRLIGEVAGKGVDESIDLTAQALANAWETVEGKEGISAFLEKRTPSWRMGD